MVEDIFKKHVSAAMVAAAERVRDIDRCRRVYGIALYSLVEESRALPPYPFLVLDQFLRGLVRLRALAPLEFENQPSPSSKRTRG